MVTKVLEMADTKLHLHYARATKWRLVYCQKVQFCYCFCICTYYYYNILFLLFKIPPLLYTSSSTHFSDVIPHIWQSEIRLEVLEVPCGNNIWTQQLPYTARYKLLQLEHLYNLCTIILRWL